MLAYISEVIMTHIEKMNSPGVIYPIVPPTLTKPSELLAIPEERNFADPKSLTQAVIS